MRAAMRAGVPVQGITLYPIFDYPAWDDERCCPVGICGYADADGRRPVYLPLVRELWRQNLAFSQFTAEYEAPEILSDEPVATAALARRAAWDHIAHFADAPSFQQLASRLSQTISVSE